MFPAVLVFSTAISVWRLLLFSVGRAVFGFQGFVFRDHNSSYSRNPNLVFSKTYQGSLYLFNAQSV